MSDTNGSADSGPADQEPADTRRRPDAGVGSGPRPETAPDPAADTGPTPRTGPEARPDGRAPTHTEVEPDARLGADALLGVGTGPARPHDEPARHAAEHEAEHAAEAEARLPAAVLWDMDGTLVDTEPYWFASERDLVDRYGSGDWPDHHAHAMVGFDLLDAAAYLQEHGDVDLPAEEIVDRLLDGVIARLHRTIPWRPGARELLADLNEAGVPCALVTMSWRRFTDPVLAALPDHSFVASITGDEVPRGRGKPHPDPYLLGADACGAVPEDCLAIEDSPTGVRSALAAGCRVIGVPNVKALARERGLTIVESLDDLRLRDLAEIMSAPDEAPVRALPFDLDQRRAMILIGAFAVLVLAIVWLMSRGDDSPEPIALPPGAIPVDVWAPYWTLEQTLPESELRLADVREVSPFWFGARGVDEIVVDENASADRTAEFIDRIAGAPGRFVPSIRDEMPAGGMAAILADPMTRSQHVETIMTFARDLDVDGIDLDYEQFAFADGRGTWAATRPDWVAFVTELADELHADDLTLTVSIPPVWGLSPDVIEAAADSGDGDSSTTVPIETASGYWVYDHGAIAAVVDAIRIMTYDYSVAEPGPIAPIWWIDDAVASTSAVVPQEFHDKLVLGVASYGSNWVVATIGNCPPNAEGKTNVTARSVFELADLRGGAPLFDPSTSEWSFAYALTVEDATTSCVQNRQVHWVDAEGAAARAELARRAGWGGVALWALGYEDDDVWQAILSASRDPLTADPSTPTN